MRLQDFKKIYKQNLILTSLSEGKKRAIQRVVKGKTSTWLTVLPVSHYHFDLSPSEFRDVLAIRYHQPLMKLPADCDGCGGEFTLSMLWIAEKVV